MSPIVSEKIFIPTSAVSKSKSRGFNCRQADPHLQNLHPDARKPTAQTVGFHHCCNTRLIVRLLLVLRVALSAAAMLLGSLPRLVVRLIVVAVRLLRVSMRLLKVAARLLRVPVRWFVIAVLLLILLLMHLLLLMLLLLLTH